MNCVEEASVACCEQHELMLAASKVMLHVILPAYMQGCLQGSSFKDQLGWKQAAKVRKLATCTNAHAYDHALHDREKIEENVKNSYPPFAKLKSKNFQYAFKIRCLECSHAAHNGKPKKFTLGGALESTGLLQTCLHVCADYLSKVTTVVPALSVDWARPVMPACHVQRLHIRVRAAPPHWLRRQDYDKSNPQAWIKADKVTVFPPEEVMGGTAQEQLSKLFNPESIAQMFSKS
eukprot:scaffold195323_cov16-Tisochrysis_lutea.AAC.1